MDRPHIWLSGSASIGLHLHSYFHCEVGGRMHLSSTTKISLFSHKPRLYAWSDIIDPHQLFWYKKLSCCCDSRSYCVRRTVDSCRPSFEIAVVSMSILLIYSFKACFWCPSPRAVYSLTKLKSDTHNKCKSTRRRKRASSAVPAQNCMAALADLHWIRQNVAEISK